MNVIGPFPLYAKLNPIFSQILHMRSVWNSFKIFTVSLSAEEIVNGTFNLPYLNFRFCCWNSSAFHDNTYLFTHDLMIATSQYVGDTCHVNETGQGHVRPKSSGVQFFTATINTPASSSLHFYFARPLSHSIFPNPSTAATSSSPVRKSFTASTSSSSYSRRLRISSLYRHRSCLPLPS